MPTEDDFGPEDPLPLFLSGHADENEQQGSLLLLNAGILVMTAALVGIAITLSWGNPVKLFADVWAAKEDARAQVDPVQQVEPMHPVQDARAQILENAPSTCTAHAKATKDQVRTKCAGREPPRPAP